MLEKVIKNNQTRFLFKEFVKINETAQMVYSAVQGGIDLNFLSCYKQYEDGTFGYVKEAGSFTTGMEIYENLTGNDGWDMISQAEDEFGDNFFDNMTPEEIKSIRKQLSELFPDEE